VVGVSLGVMKTAMVDAPSYAHLAALRPLGPMGEILPIDGGQSAGERSLPVVAVEAT
jgi:hypothetical protein